MKLALAALSVPHMPAIYGGLAPRVDRTAAPPPRRRTGGGGRNGNGTAGWIGAHAALPEYSRGDLLGAARAWAGWPRSRLNDAAVLLCLLSSAFAWAAGERLVSERAAAQRATDQGGGGTANERNRPLLPTVSLPFPGNWQLLSLPSSSDRAGSSCSRA